MGLKQFGLQIGNTDYSSDVAYPIKIEDTTLTEKLSTYNIPLKATDFAEPLSPHKVATLTLLEDGQTADSKNLILLTDSVSKNGVRDNYDHQLELIEATYRLELKVLPNMAITRIRDEYEPTLLDVVRKILDIVGLESVEIETETAEILNQIDSPEWTLTRMTALEALRLVMNHEVGLIPYMKNINELSHKRIEQATASGVDQFITKSSAYDPQMYRSSLYSPADNLVAGEDLQKVIEPKAGWMTVRSDETRISADTATLKTQFPIYAADQLWLNGHIYYVETEGDNVFRVESKHIEDIGLDKIYSLASFLYEAQEYEVLEDIIDIDVDGEAEEEDRYMNVSSGKGSSLFYQRGEKDILGLSDAAPARFRWFPSQQSIFNIVNAMCTTRADFNFYTGNSLVSSQNRSIRGLGLIKPQYLDDFVNEMSEGMDSGPSTVRFIVFVPEGYDVNFSSNSSPASLEVSGVGELGGDDLFKLQFRVEYYPLTNTLLKSYRPHILNGTEEIESSQYYNQTATVISSSALGELHRRVLERGSGNQQLMNYLHKDFDDMIDTGVKYEDYVFSAANHVINATSIQSDYTLNQFKQKLNKYVGVLEEYRQYLIPNENIVQRDVAVDLFVKADFEQETYPNTEPISRSFYTGDQSCRTIQLTGDFTNDRYYLPAVSYGFNNAAVISANTETNNIVGYKFGEEEEDNRYFRNPVVYTDPIGQLNNIYLRVGSGVRGPWDLDDSNDWPLTQETMNNLLWQGWKTVRKDSREQLNFNIGFHHVSQNPKIHFTTEWPQALGMTGGVGFDEFEVVMLASEPRTNNESDLNVLQKTSLNYSTDNGSIKLQSTLTQEQGVVCWGIVAEGKLLMWVDEEVTTTTSDVWLNFDTEFSAPSEEVELVRVRAEATNGAPITIESSTVTATSTLIDVLIPKGENVLLSAPAIYAGQDFQLWFQFPNSPVSQSNQLQISSISSDVNLRAGYQ